MMGKHGSHVISVGPTWNMRAPTIKTHDRPDAIMVQIDLFDLG